MKKLLLALTLIAATAFSPALAQDNATGDGQARSKAEIETIINDYLMENPEALANALTNMQNYFRQAEKDMVQRAITVQSDALFANPADFTMGPKDAPITIVEFFDYNCGYCKRVFPTLMEVLNENDDVRVVFKELPILSEASRTAAQTALALDDQLSFLTFHAKLMNNKSRLSEAFIGQTLSDMGVDKAAVEARRQSPAINQHLDANAALANDLQIEGTPAFVIGNQVLPGALDKQEFEDVLAQMRAELAR
jgi:protein-disulfide isomerase